MISNGLSKKREHQNQTKPNETKTKNQTNKPNNQTKTTKPHKNKRNRAIILSDIDCLILLPKAYFKAYDDLVLGLLV